MTTTPILGATELVASQAIPETTVNEMVRRMEQGALSFTVKDQTNSVPGSPADGDAYVVTATASGAWTGWEKSVAYYQTGTGWLRITPREGMFAWVQDENKLYVYGGTTWGEFAPSAVTVGLPETAPAGQVVVSNGDGTYSTGELPGGVAVTPGGATTYRFITTTAGVDGGSALSELDFYDHNGTEVFASSITASATTSGAATNLDDNTLGSSGIYSVTGAGWYVEVVFATPVKLKTVVVWAYEDGVNNYTPQGWKFAYYDVGTASLVDIGSFTRSPNWSGSGVELRTCDLDDFTPSSPVVDPVVTEAPDDANVYGRSGEDWALVVAKAGGAYTGDISVPDDAYDSTGWNGNTEVPTKNAVRDEIEALRSASQPFDADLSAIAGLTSAADRVPYYTGSGTAALATFTSFGRSLVDDADKAAGQATLGIVVVASQAAYDALGSWDSTTIYLVKE